MKVYELIELLQEFDPEADVFLGTQPSYPFEHTIAGLVERREFALHEMLQELEYALPEDIRERDVMVAEWENDPDYGQDFHGRQQQGNDVLILESQQTCYGNRDAWDAARR
jgi:hypothetical protein